MGPSGTHYATSVDGETWDLPHVGRWYPIFQHIVAHFPCFVCVYDDNMLNMNREVDGSLDNNVAVDPTVSGAYSIARDEGDPDPSKRYKQVVHKQSTGACAFWVHSDGLCVLTEVCSVARTAAEDAAESQQTASSGLS